MQYGQCTCFVPKCKRFGQTIVNKCINYNRSVFVREPKGAVMGHFRQADGGGGGIFSRLRAAGFSCAAAIARA
jgi:hypothetical protein